MDGSRPDGVPCRRGPSGGANPISDFTDGNTVRSLVDGKEYMRAWHEGLLLLHGQPGAEFQHAGWRFESLLTLGATAPESDALKEIVDAQRNGVNVFVLACRNMRCLRFNQASIRWLRLKGVRMAFLDGRFPPGGSNHQKFTVMKTNTTARAILGSVDLAKMRWDSPEHLAIDPERHPLHGKQTHEAAVDIEGPAAVDVEKTFCERWNDRSGVFASLPIPPARPPITTPLAPSSGQGTQSVQVLRTYGITPSALGYSWSSMGEFTVWASHLNAVKKAAEYIYIEDQYFLPFDWPPSYARSGPVRDTDIIFQLGEAMKRGVEVVVIVPSAPTGIWRDHQKYHRDVGVNYLQNIRAGGSPGNFTVASLECEGSDIYVHSKLMIVDDEFVSIGSANIGRRSMTNDSELHVGVVDEENIFAREFRVKLWAEHTELPADHLADPHAALSRFTAGVSARQGHLKPYPVDHLAVYPPTASSTPPRSGHHFILRRGLDPYAGPRGLG
jgi:phosphatidylserine/phosphatidylglycerophosphate/cardiolipin synthase-like enzyme